MTLPTTPEEFVRRAQRAQRDIDTILLHGSAERLHQMLIDASARATALEAAAPDEERRAGFASVVRVIDEARAVLLRDVL